MSGAEWWLTAGRVHVLREIVGRNIRQERELAGMTRQDLWLASGIAVSTIQRLENAKSDPRLTSLVALARGLGVPLETLLADVQESSRYGVTNS